MQKSSLKVIALLLSIQLVTSCGGPGRNSGGETAGTDSDSQEKKYKVYVAPDSHAYPNASIKLAEPSGSELGTDSTTYRFEVTNYELGIQTPDAQERGIANSGKGQHIHYIEDNDPYSAHYKPEFKKKLEEGRHVVLAFLSRSYHESVKNEYVLKEFVVGESEDTASFDMDGEHLFYSRPKGTYSGKDTEKLMLDFFLHNTTLSEDGNKVRATINGEEHMLTEWKPYFIEGLEKGTVTIKLELIDSDGNVIPGPYNTVTREVTLEE